MFRFIGIDILDRPSKLVLLPYPGQFKLDLGVSIDYERNFLVRAVQYPGFRCMTTAA
jgi:hypothetical protein